MNDRRREEIEAQTQIRIGAVHTSIEPKVKTEGQGRGETKVSVGVIG